MNKSVITSLLLVGSLFGLFWPVFAQEGPTLTATLDSQTPVAKSISAGAQYVDIARITLTASVGDVFLKGIFLGTDVAGGLSNFTNIYIYDTYDSTLLGTYPNLSENPNLVEFGSAIVLGNGSTPKTYLIKASLASSATGNVRLGFTDLTFTTLAKPTLVGVPIYSNVMTLPGTVATPTPVSTSSPQASPTPSPLVSPEPTALPTATPTPSPASKPTPTSLGFTSLSALGLNEGNTISASILPARVGSSDPDIYIVNEWGYKRLFLNPIIFGFYGHLGGFSEVKNIASSTGSVLVTSGLFRNCETSDSKVYGLKTTGEDTGVLHWVNTSGTQAVIDDPDFFKKVFCINTSEFNWYPKGSNYASVNQVPSYFR